MREQTNNSGFFKRLFSGGNENADVTSPGSPRGKERQVLVHAAENFHSLCVEDVMVPRAEMIAVPLDINLKDLTQSFQDAGHSRMPVYGETLDEPSGFVHVKDLLGYLALNAKDRSTKVYADKQILCDILRPVLYVPASMSADTLLKKMRIGRVHMAIVVDEYGGTDGLVTLEDLIEQIVGDIEDEHDEIEPEIRALKDKAGNTYWIAHARVGIEDFEKKIGREIATPEEDEEVDTLGGLVVALLGRVPERSEIISSAMGIEFEILEADPRRIKRMRIRQTPLTSAET